MITINLLPEECTKKKTYFKKIDLSTIDLKKIPFVKIGIILVVSLMVFHALLFWNSVFTKSKFAELSREFNAILPRSEEVEMLKAKAEGMNRRVKAIDELMVKRFSWAKKLNALSDSVISGIWLSELDYDESLDERPVRVIATAQSGKGKSQSSKPVMEKRVLRYLVLSGYATSKGEDGTATVGKFIKGLKNSPNFYSDMKEIGLKSIRSDTVAGQEVMNFKINCLFMDKE